MFVKEQKRTKNDHKWTIVWIYNYLIFIQNGFDILVPDIHNTLYSRLLTYELSQVSKEGLFEIFNY